jgi:hypothetical protein
MPTYQLAQVNVARLLAPLDSEQLAGFVASLEPINALADQSPGFIWRLKTEAGNATGSKAFDDTMILINLSVWESIEALRRFVFDSPHTPVMKRRREWFDKFKTAYVALWWIESGHIPTPDEAIQRLHSIDQYGSTQFAFTFRQPFDKP